MHRQKPAPVNASRFKPWLAAKHGRLLLRNHESSAPPDAPETVLEVAFEGLTQAEQRAALAGFPGGRRVRLATSRH